MDASTSHGANPPQEIEIIFDIVYIDTIDVCNLKCPNCLRGSRVLENSNKKMPIDLFNNIIEKCARQGTRRIGLFNWTEPFLNRDLQSYIKIVKDHNLDVVLSSTLSLRRIEHLEGCLLAGIDTFIVSISGLTQEIAELYHVGVGLNYVISNLRRASGFVHKNNLTTDIVLRYLLFPHNVHQLSIARDLADELGVSFEDLTGCGDPKVPFSFMDEKFYREQMINAITKSAPEDFGKICPLMFGQSVIDASGNEYLCCATPTLSDFKIGQFLELSEGESLLRKFRHPFCKACAFERRNPSLADVKRLSAAILNSNAP
jgi:MoaA/NifB/PqqE/SkfB family radical SAM enzyme